MKRDEKRRAYSLIGVLGITTLAFLMLVSIAGATTTTVTFYMNQSSGTGEVPLTMTFTCPNLDTIMPGNPPIFNWIFGDGTTSTNQNPTHTYSKAGIYTASITVTQSSIVLASDTSTINVSKSTPTIMWDNPSDITYVTALSSSYQVNYDPSAFRTQLNARAVDLSTYIPVDGTFTYTPPDGTVLNAGTWTLHVDFTPSDTANYNSVSKDVTINVLKKNPISGTAIGQITYGTALSRNNVILFTSVPGTFTYTPPEGTVLNAGNQTITIDFTPSDTANYNSVSVPVTINVSKATPTITWNNLADIRDKTILSNSQLNAVASVPGTFTYTPSEGTILNAGTQTLKVDFTPTDTANYNSVSKIVAINVLSNNGNGNTNGNNGNGDTNNGNHGNGNNGNGHNQRK